MMEASEAGRGKIGITDFDFSVGVIDKGTRQMTFGLAGLAQLAARQSHNLKVESSILSLRKRFFDSTQIINYFFQT